jgi:hypothetical protein
MARGGGDRVDGPVEVLDAHEHRRSDPDGRAAGAEHVGEFAVRAVVLVDEIRRWLPEPDATSHQAIVVIVAEYAASLVDPIFGDRFDPVTAS